MGERWVYTPTDGQWVPAAGDRVALIAECEDGPDPNRVGVVIDASTVDLEGEPLVGVDFPFADRVMVLPPAALQAVEDDPAEELGYPELRSPKLRETLDRIGRDLGVNIELTPLPAGGLASIVDRKRLEELPPDGIDPHRYVGRADTCGLHGCGKPSRNTIHDFTPPYRLQYLDDLEPGDRVFLGDHPRRWDEGSILEKRDGDGIVWLIVVDSDGDQRGINGHRYTTVPVPL